MARRCAVSINALARWSEWSSGAVPPQVAGWATGAVACLVDSGSGSDFGTITREAAAGWRGFNQPSTGSPGTEAHGAETEKKSLHASERDTEEARRRREEFVQHLRTIAPEKLTFLDESGVTTRMT